MAKVVNLARQSTSTTGDGLVVTLGPAVEGYISLSAAGVSEGDVVSYGIEDNNSREVGRGTYSSGTLSRDTVISSTNGGARIALSGAAQVLVTPLAEDLTDILDASAKVVGTIAELQALTGASGDALYVREYRTGSGRGGGWFRYDSTDSTTPDDGFLTIVDADSRRWKRIIGPEGVDGWMAGARFDGSVDADGVVSGTDDTAALQKICDYIRNRVGTFTSFAHHAIARFGEGQAVISGSLNLTEIRASWGWELDGRGCTLLGNGANKIVLDLASAWGGHISDLNVYGCSANRPACGIYIARIALGVGCDRMTLTKCVGTGYFTYAPFINVTAEQFQEQGCIWRNEYDGFNAAAYYGDAFNSIGWQRGVTITGITQANPAVVTAAGHGYSNGHKVMLVRVQGMTEINNNIYTVQNVTADTFELAGVDSTGFSAYTSGGRIHRQFFGSEFATVTLEPWNAASMLTQRHESCSFICRRGLCAIWEGAGDHHSYDNCFAICAVYDDPAYTPVGITNITQANPAVVSAAGHGLSNGQAIYLEDVGGMSQVDGHMYVVAGATADTFELQGYNGGTVDSTSYDAYTSGGTVTRQIDTKATAIIFVIDDVSGAPARMSNCEYKIHHEATGSGDTHGYARQWGTIWGFARYKANSGPGDDIVIRNTEFLEFWAGSAVNFLSLHGTYVNSVTMLGGGVHVPRKSAKHFGLGDDAGRLFGSASKWMVKADLTVWDTNVIPSNLAAREGKIVDIDNAVVSFPAPSGIKVGVTTITSDALRDITFGTDGPTIIDTSTLTADRLRRFSNTGAQITGSKMHISHKGSGGNLTLTDLGSSATLATLTPNQWASVVWNGTAWELLAFGSLP